MNIQSNAMPEPALIATRPFYWSVRRELWEHRSIYLAPLAAAAIALFGFLIATIGRALSVPDPVKRLAVLEEPYHFAMGLIMGSAFIVSIFYCLEALYSERRDRSILFWKSLPVSDLTTVLSKVATALVILPLLSFVITIATQSVMLLLSTAVARASGLDVAALWTKVALFQNSLGLLNHILTVHVLWYAPFYGWLLLVSAWARRAPFLWAALPPFAIGVLEKIAFNTSHFAAMLQYRLLGSAETAPMTGSSPVDPMTEPFRASSLSSPGLWIGLVIATVFLAAAVRMRRYRDPI
jgi:ABC-2 type transport system permease protein